MGVAADTYLRLFLIWGHLAVSRLLGALLGARLSTRWNAAVGV